MRRWLTSIERGGSAAVQAGRDLDAVTALFYVAEQYVTRRGHRVVVHVAIDPQRHRRVMTRPLGRRRHSGAAVEHPRRGGVPGAAHAGYTRVHNLRTRYPGFPAGDRP